jgi:glycosyltransferase involved in cell wall biosynthesis
MSGFIPQKLLIINHSCGVGSVGKICVEIAKHFEANGSQVKIAYGRVGYVPEEYKKYAIRIGGVPDILLHAAATRITDRHGLYSRRATRNFIKWAEEFNPDMVWLHCIHGYYINYEMLFEWIKSRPSMQVKWTQHDCWAFTGHCSHFMMSDCEKWKTQCEKCPEKHSYPSSFIADSSKKNYKRKREAFSGVKNLQLITPSEWLKNVIKDSFLHDYETVVVHNTIDTNIFKYRDSTYRKELCIEDKTVILAVASVWSIKKGLEDIIKLSYMLDNAYAIVIIGLSDKQIKKMTKIYHQRGEQRNIAVVFSIPNNKEIDDVSKRRIRSAVINRGVENLYSAITGESVKVNTENEGKYCDLFCIPKVMDQTKMAKLFSMADVFINPTYEDNYPTVNLEAQACGLPVITYDTGGCKETIREIAINDR